MAKLAECPRCKQKKGTNATTCPHCGMPANTGYGNCPTCDAPVGFKEPSCPHCGEVDFDKREIIGEEVCVICKGTGRESTWNHRDEIQGTVNCHACGGATRVLKVKLTDVRSGEVGWTRQFI